MSKAYRLACRLRQPLSFAGRSGALGAKRAAESLPSRQGTGGWRRRDGAGRRLGATSGGREMGPPASMHVDIDGESIWAFIRCDETNPVTLANGGRFGIDCLDKTGRIKNIDTIYKFNANGEVVKSFGAGMFIWPHGLHVDKEGNVWATDGASPEAVAIAAKAGKRSGIGSSSSALTARC